VKAAAPNGKKNILEAPRAIGLFGKKKEAKKKGRGTEGVHRIPKGGGKKNKEE